jgi:FkbM family methyltransferase
MADARRKAISAMKWLSSRGPQREIRKSWLLRTAGALDRKFAGSGAYSLSEFGEYLQIRVSGQIFLWPKDAPHHGILQILSEIFLPDHPHQYLYGQTQITADDVVLDIGACEGAFSAFVTSRCKRVIAVEPSRTMCDLIPALFALRNEPSPLLLNCLLGSEPSTAYFLENKSNPGASCITSTPEPGAYEVPVKTLDEIVEALEHKPTFIKCDAEGAEPAIFNGGKRFLSRYRPKLAITTYHNDGDFAQMHSLLTSLNYNVEGKGLFYSPGLGTLRIQMIHAW